MDVRRRTCGTFRRGGGGNCTPPDVRAAATIGAPRPWGAFGARPHVNCAGISSIQKKKTKKKKTKKKKEKRKKKKSSIADWPTARFPDPGVLFPLARLSRSLRRCQRPAITAAELRYGSAMPARIEGRIYRLGLRPSPCFRVRWLLFKPHFLERSRPFNGAHGGTWRKCRQSPYRPARALVPSRAQMDRALVYRSVCRRSH